MFSQNEVTLAELNEKLDKAKKILAAQEKSLQKSKDVVKTGGNGGFVPVPLREELLITYRNQVRDLENRIKSLESPQSNENKEVRQPSGKR
jgi:hypothetical protein